MQETDHCQQNEKHGYHQGLQQAIPGHNQRGDSAGLGYILRVGTPIGRASGRVTAIERDRVVVEQWTSNVFGEEQRSVIVKELDAGEEAKR